MATPEDPIKTIKKNERNTLRELIRTLPQASIPSRIFIERPRFAIVIAIVMTLIGVFAIQQLPVAQYPEIVPPQVWVSANYPGANAIDLAKAVGIPLEQEINGVEDMLYMSSSSNNTGAYSLSVVFAMDSDRNMNMVRMQNRIAQVTSKLPSEVIEQGISVRTRSADMLGIFILRSPNQTFSRSQVSDYIYNNIREPLLRLNGIGDVSIWGPRMAMRIWLDPERLAAQKISVEQVTQAIRSQNIQASLGSVGASPVKDKAVGQVYTVTAEGRLNSPEEFEKIIIRSEIQGGLVRLNDIATVELGEDAYRNYSEFNGDCSIAFGIYQMPGENAIETMNRLRVELDAIRASLPSDLALEVSYAATDFVEASIKEIITTLLITFMLVVLICYIFLQDWRATLIPLITIPVSLLSTFFVLNALGFSINTLTLFALVLAIGVVVDDAIVVVERVIYHMEHNKLKNRIATLLTMREVTSAVIATTLVLLAIFVPIGFISGITGRIYLQFAVTISVAVVFSTVNALTLSPALCATILRVPKPHRHGPFAWFNSMLNIISKHYVWLSKWLSRKRILIVLVFAGMGFMCNYFITETPTSFLPFEDQGRFTIDVRLKEGVNLPVTIETTSRLSSEIQKLDGVISVAAISGRGQISGNAESVGRLVITLKPWKERMTPELHVSAIVKKVQAITSKYHNAQIIVMTPPAIMGLGSTGGLDFRFQSRKSLDPVVLEQNLNAFLASLRQAPELTGVYSPYTAMTPHLKLIVDREKAEMYKVPINTLFSTLQNYLGSRYVNDINLGTQVNRVIVQSEWATRATPDALDSIYAQSETGDMVPVTAMLDTKIISGPRDATRFNLFPSARITATAADGYSSGEAMAAVERVAKETLSKDFSFAWAGISYQEREASGQTMALILAGILFGYLFLVAQYESWTIPIPVMLSVVVAILGALIGLYYTDTSLSIYTQLGLVLLVGLAAKNAILIVEFAVQRREQGLTIIEAAGDAAGQRLRAVLMTALTFVLGVLPLVYASGAGAGARQEIGTTVFYGMIFATTVGILLIPALFSLFQHLREGGKRLRERFSSQEHEGYDTIPDDLDDDI